jgi:hypothetical protein
MKREGEGQTSLCSRWSRDHPLGKKAEIRRNWRTRGRGELHGGLVEGTYRIDRLKREGRGKGQCLWRGQVKKVSIRIC